MPDITPLLSLLKPTGSEVVSVASFNTNSDILDNAVTLTGLQTLTNKTLTAPALSSPTVSSGLSASGGITITNGGLTVSAGNIGVGTAPAASIGIRVDTSSLTGASQYGAYVNPTVSSAADNAYGVYAGVSVVVSGSPDNAYGVYVPSPTMGGGASIAANYGIYIAPQTASGTSNYGMVIGAPSGGSTNNIGLSVEGGGVLIEGTAPSVASKLGLGGSSTTTATAGSNGDVPAQVAGYLVATFDNVAIRIPYYSA